jgi:alanyl-tRNA synthetase
MTANELRKKYIEFFKSRDHAEISGKSLIPENDPSALFTMAGMHPLVPFLKGEKHPAGNRLTNYQKCIRTGDIEEVGDPSHLTFFEMLGNWSLGDYFKREAIAMSYEFLTSSEWLGIDPQTLNVSVFSGNELVEADEESAEAWRSLGIPEDRIFYLPETDNWWSIGSGVGPCGPDTEMFIDTGKDECGSECRPGCHCGKYFEVWNDVFMQYNQTAEGTFEPLRQKSVDTGMGIERTAAMLQGKQSVFDTELFVPIIKAIEDVSNKKYGDDFETDTSIRIIVDHIKAAVFILGDEKGVTPSNLGAGYILRRLIRRALRHGRKISIPQNFLIPPAEVAVEINRDVYPLLEAKKDFILQELQQEEDRFLNTLEKGEHEFEKMLPNLKKSQSGMIPGRVAFRLYDTYGFPLEITEELASEHGLKVDHAGFEKAFRKHQEKSKQGSEKSFKGGLADHSKSTTALHTATHLIHQALRMVLGDHVEQKGSNINPERLRFDFSHGEKMTPEEIKRVEDIVNEQIKKDLPVSFQTMTLGEAKDSGAIALFGDRYDEVVKVYSVGDFSKEVCGGPHVEHLGELGGVKIVKEQSSSAGVRRIKAVLRR